MATNVIMPALGVAQETGTLINWLKVEGQPVAKGEPLMEVETDKATVEIEAPASGILANVTAQAGAVVPVGQTIALLVAPGESVPAEPRAAVPSAPSASTKEIVPAPAAKKAPAPVSRESSGGRLLASPAARRIAREKGIDLALLSGSGPDGSILSADVLSASTRPEATPVASTYSARQVVTPSPMRRIVGQRMAQSKQNAPHFYISMDIDMTAVTRLRGEWKDRGESQPPSINDFILRACARALKDFPSLNSTYTEQGIALHADINIGSAVALEEGLVVPVIHNADGLSLTELAMRSRELIDKARGKKLFPRDYEGGTFTVSNLGMLGVDSFVAIINPPQCAILAVGRVAPRVVAEDGMFAIRSLTTATLSADHRIVDGAIGARFLQKVKGLLERPEPQAHSGDHVSEERTLRPAARPNKRVR